MPISVRSSRLTTSREGAVVGRKPAFSPMNWVKPRCSASKRWSVPENITQIMPYRYPAYEFYEVISRVAERVLPPNVGIHDECFPGPPKTATIRSSGLWTIGMGPSGIMWYRSIKVSVV